MIAIIFTSFVLAFGSSNFISSFFSLLSATVSYPVHQSMTWILIRTGLYTLSRDMTVRANALKDRDKKATAIMKANALRENMELKAMKELWRENDIELQETLPSPSRPNDLERAESTGSEVKMYYSPRT